MFLLQRPRQGTKGSEPWAKTLASVLISARVCLWGEHIKHRITVLGGAYKYLGTEHDKYRKILQLKKKPFNI